MNAPAPSPARPRGTSLRRWALVAAGIGLIVLLIAGFMPKPVPVEMRQVERRAFRASVRDEGRAEVRNRYLVTSPVAGRMRRIPLKPGAELRAGETELVVLETAPADLLDSRAAAQAEARVRVAFSALERAEAQAAAADAQAAVAASEARRAAELVTAGALSEQDAEQLQTRSTSAAQSARAARFSVEVARHEVTIANAALESSRAASPAEALRILSPINGRLLRVFQESERTVAPGTPLIEIGDPTDLEVRIEVLSRDGVAIRPGAPMLLHQWGGDQPLEARVRYVEPAAFTKISALGVEEQRVHVVGDLLTPHSERAALGDGYRVEGEIVVEDTADAIVVPSGSVFRTQTGAAVYVVESGRAVLRPVKVGRINGREARIEEGLQPGEVVVVYPPSRLAPSGRVKGEATR